MKTQDLVAQLGQQAQPVDARKADLLLFVYLGVGAMLSVLITLALFGVRADWRVAAAEPMFWLKFAFPAIVALAALATLSRLGFPGARLGARPAALAAPLLLAGVAAAFALWHVPSGERWPQLLGQSWWTCTLAISALSIPAGVGAFLAMRQLAPTRLALTGATAGAFAGGVSALAYAMYCTEMQVPFVGTWYTLGMLLPATVGAVVGSRWLRW